MKMIKVKCGDAIGGYRYDGRGAAVFSVSREEAKKLGEQFVSSQFFDKLFSAVKKRLSGGNYSDAGFMAKAAYKFLRTSAVKTFYMQFLKNVFKNNEVQGYKPNPDRMAQEVYDSLLVSEIEWPAIEKIMASLAGKDWRKYIR